jgi:alpha-galactosidase
VKSIADAIVSQGLDKLGYKYVNLDDCWSDTKRDAQGRLQPVTWQFPSGMKALADYVHARGLKLGLYTDSGTETCRGKRPGSYGHYDIDAQTMADWYDTFLRSS